MASAEIISRIYEMHAKDRIAKDKVTAGSIVALVGLKNSITGETLCGPRQPDHPRTYGFPRTGHQHEHRAGHPGRQRKARQRAGHHPP